MSKNRATVRKSERDLSSPAASILKALKDAALDESDLDEAVHDCKAAEATDINNSGLEAQVQYLLSAGLTEAQILERAGL